MPLLKEGLGGGGTRDINQPVCVRTTHTLELSVPLRGPTVPFQLLLSQPSSLSKSTKDKSSALARVKLQ